MAIKRLTLPDSGMIRMIRDQLGSGYTPSTVIRELFQNADDAGAKRLVIGFHPGLPAHPEAIRRRPGLVVMNNGPVSSEDVVYLRHVKANQRASDPYTIGRFGIGKVALFNWADAYFLDVSAGAVDCGDLITVFPEVWEGIGGDLALREPIEVLASACAWPVDDPRLALWLPIRVAADQHTIQNYDPERLPDLKWIRKEATWLPYLRMLPMLRTLRSLEIWEWDKEDVPKQVLEIHLEGDQRHAKLLEGSAPIRDFQGRILTSTQKSWRYWGREQRLSDNATVPQHDTSIRLSELKIASDWPKDPENQNQPELKIPHGAVLIIHRDGVPKVEVPDITLAAFLPLGDRNLGKSESQVVFHANGFLNEQRSHFLGIDGSEDQQTQAAWNHAILGGATLPLLPKALEKALEGLADAEQGWVETLARNSLIQNNTEDVSRRECFLRVYQQDSPSAPWAWHWQAVGHQEQVLRLRPATVDRMGQAIQSLVIAGLVIVDEAAPKIGDWTGTLGLTPRLVKVMADLAREFGELPGSSPAFQEYAQLIHAVGSQVQDEEKGGLPLPVKGHRLKVLLLENLTALHRSGHLWIDNETQSFPDWTRALDDHIEMWQIAAPLQQVLQLGRTPSAENFLHFLNLLRPTLNLNFADRLPLIRRFAQLPVSPGARKAIRYLLHAEVTHLEDEEAHLLIELPLVGRAGDKGALHDLQVRLASESPSWTRLPEETGRIFAIEAQQWLGLITYDAEGTLRWALANPDRVAAPRSRDADKWNAEALTILADHLGQPTKEHFDAWARLPLHRDVKGNYGPINPKDAYRRLSNSPAWIPEGVQVLQPYEAQDPMYDAFFNKLDTWTHWRVVGWVLDQVEPWHNAQEILDHLKGAGGLDNLPADVRTRFDKASWVPVEEGARGVPLSHIVHLPQGEGRWKELLEAASGRTGDSELVVFTESSITKAVRHHAAWAEQIQPVFERENKNSVFQIRKLVRAAEGDFSLGFPGMIQLQPEFLIMAGLDFEGMDSDQAPALALQLLAALSAEGMTFTDLKILLDTLGTLKQPTNGELKALFKALGISAQRPGPRWEGTEMAREIFRKYLATLGHTPGTSDFAGLSFSNHEGKWYPASHFPNPELLDQNRDRNHFLAKDWHEPIIESLFEWPDCSGLVEDVAGMDLATYFKPWLEEGVPPAYVACFLSVLGINYRTAALDHLRNHAHGGEAGLLIIREKLSLDGALMSAVNRHFHGDPDHQKSHAFDQHRFLVSIAGQQDNRFYSGLDGQRLELKTAADVLVQMVVPSVSIRSYCRSTSPGAVREVSLRLAPPLARGQGHSWAASTLMERIKDGVQEILEKAYCNNYTGDEEEINRTLASNNWNWLWDEFLAHQEQLHLRSVQANVKRYLYQTVKMLFKDIPRNLAGRNLLQDLLTTHQDAARAEAEATDREGMSPRTLEPYQLTLRRAELGLVTALKDPEVEQALHAGVQGHIRRCQYSPDRILFELYQNAEDAYRDWECLREKPRSPRPDMEYVLILDPCGTSLNALHWGRPICHYQSGIAKVERFRDDLLNMLTFNMSSKDEQNVGEHGLGFKSVHLISDRPTVISGPLAFTIQAGIYPETFAPEQSLPPFLAPHAARPPADLGTLIHLPITPGSGIKAEDLVREFWNCAEPLLAFSQRISTIRKVSENREDIVLKWKPRTIWAEGDLSIQWTRPSTSAHYFRIGDADYALLLRFNEKGSLELPSGAPTIWAMAPTKQIWGNNLKVMLQAPFALDPGRTRLGDADATKNHSHFMALGQRVGRALRAWLGQADPLRSLPVDREHFLTELWEGFGAPLGRYLAWAGDQIPCASALHEGIGDLWRLDPTCPDGFGGFIAAEAVATVLNGQIWGNAEFRQSITQAWPSRTDNCILEARWNNGLSNYRNKENKPATLGEGTFLAQLLGKPFGLIPYRDLSRILEKLPDDLREAATHALQMAGPHFLLTIDESQGRSLHELALASDEGGMLLDLAPADGQVNEGYSDPNEDLLKRLRPGTLRPELIKGWCIRAWASPALQKFVKRYLQDGNCAASLRILLRHSPDAPEGLRAYVEALLARLQPLPDLDDEDIADSSIEDALGDGPGRKDGREVLQAIHQWWDDLDEGAQEEWVEKVACGLSGPDLVAADLVQKKVAWLKLLTFGAGHTLGRYEPNKLRAFIQHGPISEADWVMLATNPPSLNDPDANNQWMNLLNRRLEHEDAARSTYDHMFRALFGSIHRFAYSLETYMGFFTLQGRRSAAFDLTSVAWAGGDPLLTGSGLSHLPSLYQALGYGLVVVMRELQRLEVLQNPFLEPHGFVPYRATRKFLANLYWEDVKPPDVDRPLIHQSRQIHDLLAEALSEEQDPIFGGRFDIPIFAVASDPSLQESILGSINGSLQEFSTDLGGGIAIDPEDSWSNQL